MTEEGRLVAGRYRLGQRIGSGAMGVVWQALDERLHRTVAIKQLLLAPGLTAAQTEEARQRAMREGRIAARLQHPNAITVYDATEDEGQPWLVMEYLPSRSLADILDTTGPLPPEQAARIGAQVAGALTRAHEVGIVHRDIKPGNVLIADDGTVKITDFGISRAIGDVTVTATGMLAGTPAYLAPEMAMGEQPAPASDVFSLGSTLYAAVEGGPPFGPHENQLATLHAVAACRISPPRRAGALTPVLAELLRPEPSERPAMPLVREALQAVAAGQAVPAGLVAPLAPAAPPPPTAVAPQRGPATRLAPPPTEAAPAVARAAVAEPARRQQPRWLAVVLGVLAVAVAAVVGILVANALMGSAHAGTASPRPEANTAVATTSPAAATTTSAPSTTAATTTAAPTTTTRPAAITPQQVEHVIRDYYGKLPQHTRSAWQMLGDGVRADSGGYEHYAEFWSSIKDVSVRGITPTGDHTAKVLLRFTKAGSDGHDKGDGEHGHHGKKDKKQKVATTTELYSITVGNVGGEQKITRAQRLASHSG